MNRRIGQIEISVEMVDNKEDEVADVLAAMRFIPLRVEQRYELNSFRYIGISPLFDELADGYHAPRYIIEMISNEVEVPGTEDEFTIVSTFDGVRRVD